LSVHWLGSLVGDVLIIRIIYTYVNPKKGGLLPLGLFRFVSLNLDSKPLFNHWGQGLEPKSFKEFPGLLLQIFI
jgi:hypothetical protein